MPQTAETALEQTFSDLANARLRDKSPALLEYLVGFQLVEANEDGSRAVGIFGFEIGDSWYYAPVFFFNGELKGLDSLYGVDSDLFVPLNEDWVNQIINRKPNRVGEPNQESRDERGVRLPNYNRLRQIPGNGTGLGGASFNKLSAAKGEIHPILQKMASSRVYADLDLPSALAAMGPAVAAGFLADMRKHPKLAEAVHRFYDDIDFADISVKKAEKTDPVTIISSVAQAGAKDLTDAQKTQLIVGGLAVVDKRPEMEKSIVYRNEARHVLQTVSDGGLYEVLMADGTIASLLVLKLLGSSDKYLVYDPEDGRHGIVEGRLIFTTQVHEKAEFIKALNADSVSPDDVKAKDCVVFVNTTGDCTMGFEIDAARTGENAMKVLSIRGQYYMPESYGSPTTVGSWENRLPGSGEAIWRYDQPAQRLADVLVTDAGSGAIRYFTKQLVVNTKHFRALILNKLVKESGDGDWYTREKGTDEIKLTANDFGDHNTVLARLDKVAHPVKVWTDGCEVTIRDDAGTRNHTAVNALGYLMRKHSCSETDARAIVKEASAHPQVYRIVKRAAVAAAVEAKPTSKSHGIKPHVLVMHSPDLYPELMSQVNALSEAQNKEKSFFNPGKYLGGAGPEEVDALADKMYPHGTPILHPDALKWAAGQKTAAELLPFEDPQDMEASGTMSNFHQTQVPTATKNVSSPQNNREFYEYHSPFSGSGDENTSTGDAVERATADGQKEVFDASVLSSLVKSHNPTEMVDRFLPTIVSGMDRLGRLMFVMNWHYEEYQERYGKEDLQEFTDDLKSNFEGIGDLVIFMRKRTLAGDPESYGLGLNSTMQG